MNLHTLTDYINMGREVEFSYNGQMCSITYTFENNKQIISFCWFDHICTDYPNMEDFLSSAKIGDQYLRDVLEHVEDVTVY